MTFIVDSAKSYAIFVRSSYGDLLMTDPLIKFIKSINPKNKITLIVDNKNSQLVEFMENIDSYYVIPSKGNKYLLFTVIGVKLRKNKSRFGNIFSGNFQIIRAIIFGFFFNEYKYLLS